MKNTNEIEVNTSKELRDKRRKNAKIYPLYKMFSWDLLFFYSISFLFYTITKKVTASEILIINGFYLLFRIIGEIPAVTITDFLGKKKSIVLGNTLLLIHLIILITCPGAFSIVLANLFFAIGYDIKIIAEVNLLYDSVSTKGGEGLFSKLEVRGGSWYFILDGIASLTAGYLFVINNYLPIFICLTFVLISIIISLSFEEIYPVKKEDRNKHGFTNTFKEYGGDLKNCFKFILRSKRMKSYVLFQMVFYSIISITETYKSDLLTDIGVPPEQFSMIFAVLALIGGIALSLKKPIEKRFKNRTLSFISLAYIGACVLVGWISSIYYSNVIIPFILIMYTIQRITLSIWYILEYKYLNNFTHEKNRNKIAFTYELIGGVVASIFSILGGLLLRVANIENAFLVVGLFFFGCMVLVLDYMRKRFGLKPEEYTKEDIEF